MTTLHTSAAAQTHTKRTASPPAPTAPTTRPRTKRLAKPATSARAIAAARKRRAELEQVLAIRDAEIKRLRLDRPLDRAKLTTSQRSRLIAGPYPAAAAAYLATHDKFAYAAARKAEARHVPLDDLVQAAKLGMMRALDKFDAGLVAAGTVTSFLSYARWWVRCEVGKLFEDESLVKIPAAAKKTATEMRARMTAAGLDNATDDDVATTLSIPLDRVRLYRNLHLGHEHQEVVTTGRKRGEDAGGNAGAGGHGGHGVALAARLVEVQAERDDDTANKQRLDDVETSLTVLTALQRGVVAATYGLEVGDGVQQAQQLSEIARRSILKSALARLRCAMG